MNQKSGPESGHPGWALYDRDTITDSLGIELEEIRDGYARTTVRITDGFLNMYGTGHGGLIFTLADTAFGLACNSRGPMAFAQQCSINYIATARPGERLTAICQERSRVARTGVYDASVYGDDGRLIAEFRGISREVRDANGG
ncbi:MAG: hydroxyphenylacetyl-CoA thioesterase PaaI [Alphaproteobacteria bacterium]|jgi:acyl-CoA thioesterase|nr:hydroxyphenylacetyl-CoA thioesterase PaaI [Alphaproteobacteria bacterium]MDP6813852.1 hydroxyphenylacetyl-CoA thioesterase PaaI [Alphaproteobacteria bacterium]